MQTESSRTEGGFITFEAQKYENFNMGRISHKTKGNNAGDSTKGKEGTSEYKDAESNKI